MTKEQKKALAEIKKRIPGCFGTEDKIFAGHSSDSKRARAVLGVVLKNNIGRKDLEKIVKKYLKSKNCLKAHIDKQIKRVNNLEVYLNDTTHD